MLQTAPYFMLISHITSVRITSRYHVIFCTKLIGFFSTANRNGRKYFKFIFYEIVFDCK